MKQEMISSFYFSNSEQKAGLKTYEHLERSNTRDQMTLAEATDALKEVFRTFWQLLKEDLINASRVDQQWSIRQEGLLKSLESTEQNPEVASCTR